MRRVALPAVATALVLGLSGCSGDADPDTPEAGGTAAPSGGESGSGTDPDDTTSPATTAKPPKLDRLERSLVQILEGIGATGVGTVESETAGEGFAYGTLGRVSVVVQALPDGEGTPGKKVDDVTLASVPVSLVRTQGFGLLAAFACGEELLQVSVRKGDDPLSTSRSAVVKQASRVIKEADCAG